MSLSHVVVKGRVAVHRCGACGGVIYGVCVDGGEIPKFLSCRNQQCDSVALIDPYAVVPDERMICWEWYRPSFLERQTLKVTDPDMYVAVEHGELAIRLRNVPMARGEHTIVGA